jgi:photosystem II stability/assembly factor-like uncharacterized protein
MVKGLSSVLRIRRLAVVATLVILGLTLFAPVGGETSLVVHRSNAARPETGTGDLGGAACLSPSNCFVVGADSTPSGVVSTTTDGGSSWTTETVPSGTLYLNSISCVAPSTCYAAGETTAEDATVIVTSDAGSTWTAETLPAGLPYLGSITCPSAAECFAVGTDPSRADGYIIGTTDGGATWQTDDIIPEDSTDTYISLYGVSCMSATSCVASGTVEYFDCCSTGQEQRLSPEAPIRLQPPPTYTPVLFETTDGGTTWTQASGVPSTANGADQITCASAKTCYVTTWSTQVIVTRNSGATWQSQILPTESGEVVSVACPSRKICYAAGNEVAKTTNTGKSWTLETVPKNPKADKSLAGITCPSSDSCFASKAHAPNDVGDVVATTNGGSTWASQTVPLA